MFSSFSRSVTLRRCAPSITRRPPQAARSRRCLTRCVPLQRSTAAGDLTQHIAACSRASPRSTSSVRTAGLSIACASVGPGGSARRTSIRGDRGGGVMRVAGCLPSGSRFGPSGEPAIIRGRRGRWTRFRSRSELRGLIQAESRGWAEPVNVACECLGADTGNCPLHGENWT